MNARPRLFDLSLRTTYAQARELALSQGAVSLSTAGSIQVEVRSGRRFVYRYRYDATGARVTDYLGPEEDETTITKLAAANAEIAESAVLAEYSRDLRRIGFYGADNSTVLTAACLFNAGVFGGTAGTGGGVLVGTHAFGVLLNDLGVRAGNIPMTEDIDLARARRIEIAARPKGGLLALLRKTGLPFHDVPQLRRNEPSTSFKVRGQKLKVDLLVPATQKPYATIAVPELGAHATGLPHFRFLLGDASPSVLIGRGRIVPVVVPHAGRFCVHKLAVYSLRTGADNPKRDKDLAQAALLAIVLADGNDFLLLDAIASMDRPLRSKVKAGATRALALVDGHDNAERILQTLA